MNLQAQVCDNSTFQQFQVCPRLAFYRHVMNLVHAGAQTALDFGTAMHRGLNFIHTHRDLDEDTLFEEACCAFANKSGEVPNETPYTCPEDDHRVVSYGFLILKRYLEKYQQDPFTVIQTPEQGFAVNLGYATLVGRFDMLVKMAGGTYLLDHKTTSVMGPSWWNQFKTDSQLSAYVLGAGFVLDTDILGVYINGIGTAKSHHAGPAASDKYLQRQMFVRPKWMLEDFIRFFNKVVREMNQLDPTKPEEWEQRTWNCNTKYGTCFYQKLCELPQDLWPGVIETDYRVQPWSPYVVKEEQV